MGALEMRPAGMARCATHGGEYKILFCREDSPSLRPPVQTAPADGSSCVNHPNLPALFLCGRCNSAICDICSFEQADGSRLCPVCATERAAEPVSNEVVSVNPSAQNQQCRQHPNVAAVQICRLCGDPMCATCDFLLPGNLHVCPSCATKPQTALSPKRKGMLIASFALAVWGTLVMAALMTGVFRGMGRDPEGQQALGLLLILIWVIPAIIGTSLGVGAMDRRLSNRMAMWIAAIWNGLILGIFIVLTIIGLMAKG
jgi:hypothetical protein